MSPGDPATPKQLLARLKVGEAQERCQCLLELAEHDVPRSQLAPYLDDPEPMVRIAAVRALWQKGQTAAELPQLVGILRRGLAGDGDLPLMAGTLLVQMGEGVVPELVRQLDTQDAAAPLTVRVLGEIGGSEAVALLRSLVDHPRPEVAREARQALDALAHEAVEPPPRRS